MKKTKKPKTIEARLCPLPASQRAAVAAAREALAEIKDAGAMRNLFARILVRLDMHEKRLRVGTGESRRLLNVEWLKRRSDAFLSFRIPGAKHVHRMRLGVLHVATNCALCSVDQNPGMKAYHAGWKTSSWLRHLRVCYECGQKKSPAPKVEDILR